MKREREELIEFCLGCVLEQCHLKLRANNLRIVKETRTIHLPFEDDPLTLPSSIDIFVEFTEPFNLQTKLSGRELDFMNNQSNNYISSRKSTRNR